MPDQSRRLVREQARQREPLQGAVRVCEQRDVERAHRVRRPERVGVAELGEELQPRTELVSRQLRRRRRVRLPRERKEERDEVAVVLLGQRRALLQHCQQLRLIRGRIEPISGGLTLIQFHISGVSEARARHA